jgi:hypothetical protein
MLKKAVISATIFGMLLIIFSSISYADNTDPFKVPDVGPAGCVDAPGMPCPKGDSGSTTTQPQPKTPTYSETAKGYGNGLENSCSIGPGETCDSNSLTPAQKVKMENWWKQFNNFKSGTDNILDPEVKRQVKEQIAEIEGLAGEEPPQVKAWRLIGPLGIRTRTGSYTAEEVSPNGYPRLDYLYRTGSYVAFSVPSSVTSSDIPLMIMETGAGGLAIFEGFGVHQGEKVPLPPINPGTLSTKTVSGGYSASAKNAEDLGKVNVKTVKDPDINEEILEINLELKEGLQPGKKLLVIEIKQDDKIVGTIKLVVDILPDGPYKVEDPTSELQNKETKLFGILTVVIIIAVLVAIFVIVSMVKKSGDKSNRPKKHCNECGAKLTTEDKFCPSCGEKL